MFVSDRITPNYGKSVHGVVSLAPRPDNDERFRLASRRTVSPIDPRTVTATVS
jgi:hypothetical protein